MVLVLTEISKTLIALYFMAGRTISNGVDLRKAEHPDPQCTITRPDEAKINIQKSRQTQHTTEISESMDLHLIVKDVLY
jgi:hypothetical protein